MNFFFRTNFNEKVGLGHLFRCLRLIRHFETQKHSCYLFTDLLRKKFHFLKNFNVIPIYKKKVHFFDQKRDIIQMSPISHDIISFFSMKFRITGNRGNKRGLEG